MSDLVSVLLPTTGRPAMAKECLEGLIETTAGHDIEVVLAVDADPETFTVVSETLAGVNHHLSYSPSYRGNSKAWNDCLRESKGHQIVFAADDLVWGKGWLDEALRVQATTDGLVGFNDGHWNGWDLSTHYLMSRDFVSGVLGGCVAWEWYAHSFNDLEVNERAKRAGRFAWAENAMVYHRHWLFGDRPQDATDTRALGEHSKAEAAYKDREARGFPCDYPPVI